MGGATLVINEGAGAGSQHPVDGELILGREDGSADLVIPDPGVSAATPASSARTAPDPRGPRLSNGTYVNGRRISGPVEVADGDEVQIGDTVIGVEGRPSGRPAPRRLAPPPHEPGNIPALAALFLGPLSILLVFLAPAAFSSPCPAASARSSSARLASATPTAVSAAIAPPPASAASPASSAPCSPPSP